MNLPDRAALRHHRRQRAVPHLRRHRPAEIRRQPARRVPAGRHRARARALRRRAAASGRRSAARPSGTRSPTDGSWRRWSRPPIAVSSPRCMPRPSGCRSAPASMSPRGWPGPAASELTSPRRSRGGRSAGGAAPGCVGTAAPRLPCRRVRLHGWRPPAAVSSEYPRRSGAARSSSSSSRSTVRSTFAATRAWNATCPSVAARTSESRKSATAATSSAAVGRPYSELISDRRPPVDPARPIRFR